VLVGKREWRAASGTAMVFALSGVVQSSWMSRLPAVRDQLDAGLANLGLALLVMGIGSVLSMPLTGRLCARVGSRSVVSVSAVAACAVLVALGHVSSTATLMAVLFAFGLGCGAWDVAMNIQGAEVESQAGRHWMARFHGCWSAGTVLGAGLGVLAARHQVPTSVHFALVAVLAAPLCLAAAAFFVHDRLASIAPSPPGHGRRVPQRLVLIAVVMLCGATIEGAAGDWLAIFLRDVRDESHARAAAGYATFVAAMTIGRFTAGVVQHRIGRARTVRLGALLSGLGVGLAVLVSQPLVAEVGAACWGLGICAVFPAALSASRETPRHLDALAVMSTVGYGAGLVGPPLIGAAAQHLGLGLALLVLPALAVVVASTASALGDGPRRLPDGG
jgi:MFS family permease